MRNKLSPHTEYLLNCSIMGRDPNPDSRHQEKMEMWDEIDVVGARHAKGRKAPPKIIGAEDVPPRFPTNEDDQLAGHDENGNLDHHGDEDGCHNDYDGHEDVNDEIHHNENEKEDKP
ncbi:MAG: hypothetical protein JXA41_12835 [Deltaproteobacteria bacterium]|nr:hypothetical protein [Deltaproteobacteria bacterium]